MGTGFDQHLGEGDTLGHGTTATPTGFDPIMLVIAAASGCLFITLLISCVCCFRRPGRHSRNAHQCSRRDTVPLEDLLSKPTLADPESFFSEAQLDDKDPPHPIGFWTSNDDNSVAGVSHMSDLSTSELVGSDSGQTHALLLERKCKSEKGKRSKNFQNRKLNNELRSSAKENRRQSEQLLEFSSQNSAMVIVNDTQMDKVREEDFLYKNNDVDCINEINNTSTKKGNLGNKLKKTDNKHTGSAQRCLDVTSMAEDRVSSESFTSSARGSISHDMTASVNVLRLPRQSIIPPAESWSGSLLEESEKSTLPEVTETPSTPIQVDLSGQNAALLDDQTQSIQSATKSSENNNANKSQQDLVDEGNSPGACSVEVRPHVQDTPMSRHSPENNQPLQSNCNNADQTSGRIPERISLNLQIDFHFSDNAGCCGNQTRSYVVCSPVSVSQEIRGVSSSRVGAITTSSSIEERPIYDSQNSIPDNTNCANVETVRSSSEELQTYHVIDNTNDHSISRSELTYEGRNTSFSARTFSVSNASGPRISKKRFSAPIDFLTAREINDIELQSVEKRRFTVSDVADVEVILKKRKLVQLPCSEIVLHTSSNKEINEDFGNKSTSSATNNSQPEPSHVLVPSQASFASSNVESTQGQNNGSNISSQESHSSKAVKDSEQIQEHLQETTKNSTKESRLQSKMDNKDLDQRQQGNSNISPRDQIPEKKVGKENESQIENQNEISSNVSLTTKPEANVQDDPSNNDDVRVSNQESEIVGHPSEGIEGISRDELITVDDSISKEGTEDCSSIDTETRMEEKQSNLTPLNASIQEDDEDHVLQSEEGPSEEGPVTIGNSTSTAIIPSDKIEQTGGHCSSEPPVKSNEPFPENENCKYPSEAKPHTSEKDTQAENIKMQTKEEDKETFQSARYIEEKGKHIERHDYACKDGSRICSNDSGLSVLESEGENVANAKNREISDEATQGHRYACKDGAIIYKTDGRLGVMESEGQNYATRGDNHEKANEDIETKSEVAGMEKDVMTESRNTAEFKGASPSDRGSVPYRENSFCDENEMPEDRHDRTTDHTKIKATQAAVTTNRSENMSTHNQSVGNDNQNAPTKSSAEETTQWQFREEGHARDFDCKPAQEPEDKSEKQSSSKVGSEKPKPLPRNVHGKTSISSPTGFRDQKLLDRKDPQDTSINIEDEEKPRLKGILRPNRSFDMTFKEQDNINMNFSPIHNNLGSSMDKGQSKLIRHQHIAPFVFVSDDINVDRPVSPVKTGSEEGLLSPTLPQSTTTEDKANASDESDYDNPWDSLDEAVKRGSMRYNRRASRVADGDDAKTLMLKSAEDLGRLLEDAERRRRMRQNAARSSCQIMETKPPSPPPTFTRLSPYRHTVKGLVSHGSSRDLQDDALKSHPLKGKKDLQRSKDDLSHGFARGIDPNRSKTLSGGERSKIYSPETKKRKGRGGFERGLRDWEPRFECPVQRELNDESEVLGNEQEIMFEL